MGLVSRAMMVLKIKANAALDDIEHPVETLDYAEHQQRALLQQVGAGLIEVASSRRRLIRQAEAVGKDLPRLEAQARQAVASGRDDLARIALERKHAATRELTELEAQIAAVAEDERSMTIAHQQLTRRIEEFHRRRLTTSARYEAASARSRVGEALSGVSGEIAELSAAVRRAEERTERLQARAVAIDALLDSGALTTPLGRVDRVELELTAMATEYTVDHELARIRAEVVAIPETTA